jgi:hypothetical protein
MYFTTKERSDLTDILESQGLSRKNATHIVAVLAHWEVHHGIKEVVNRLKLRKAALLSGCSEGIATHPNGEWKGAFKGVHLLAKSGRRGAIRANRILAIYGRWEASSPVEQDYVEFSRGVRFAGYAFTGDLFKCTSRDKRVALRCQRKSDFNLALPTSDVKRVPFTNGVPEADCLPTDHARILLEQCPNIAMKYDDLFRKIFEINYLNEMSFSNSFGPNDSYDHQWDCVGRIACLTSDRGLKKRFIANPHRFIQMALSRLQDATARYLKTLPESLVYDQDLSTDWVKSQLAKGRKLYSLDLSSATDHFPFEPQRQLLSSLFPGLKRDIALWADVCSAIFESPSGKTDIKYGKGQPMGTAPSFAAFTVSHIHLVRTLGGTQDNFRVIGDDIVISDEALADRYKSRMGDLGVQISLSKSLLGEHKAEFAGRIIDKYGLWPSYKASPMDLSKDPWGYLRQYGLAGGKLLPAKIRDMLTFTARVPVIGIPHCCDYSVLDELDDISFLSLMDETIEPYSYDSFRPLKSAYHYPQTRFEKVNSEESQFRGSLGVGNSPRLVEHVNATLADDGASYRGYLSWMEESLSRGTAVPLYEDMRLKPRISYVRKLWNARKKLVDPKELGQ